MPAEDSILKSTKKILGYEHDAAFDLDIIMHVNTCFTALLRLGIGPVEGFMIEGEAETWTDFLGSDNVWNSVKTYVYLKTKSYFDPPGTPHHLAALKEQITELEHTLLTERNLRMRSGPTQALPYAVQGGSLDD